jgi:6-phosphogluconolactonase
VSDPSVHLAATLEAVAGPLLVEVIGAVVRRSGRCRLGLSGGSTPGPTLRWLAAHLPAEVAARLYVTWVDERIGAAPEDRNDVLAEQAWFHSGPAPAAVLPMPNDGDVAAFAQAFAADFSGALDVVVLGAGPDGHIASLFPGHPALEATDPVLLIDDSPKPPPTRMTLSLPVLQAVDCAVLLARGADKAPMLARALGGDETLPLGRYRPQGAYHWIVDPAAASELAGAYGGIG